MWKKTVEMCQGEVDHAKGPVLFDTEAILLALPANCPVFKGDPAERPEAPSFIPDSIMPSEVTVEDVASTSLHVDRDECCPIFTPPLKKQCPLRAKFASLRAIWII